LLAPQRISASKLQTTTRRRHIMQSVGQEVAWSKGVGMKSPYGVKRTLLQPVQGIPLKLLPGSERPHRPHRWLLCSCSPGISIIQTCARWSSLARLPLIYKAKRVHTTARKLRAYSHTWSHMHHDYSSPSPNPNPNNLTNKTDANTNLPSWAPFQVEPAPIHEVEPLASRLFGWSCGGGLGKRSVLQLHPPAQSQRA
jgi:hypothetical protein